MYNLSYDELREKSEKDLSAFRGISQSYLNEDGLSALEALEVIDFAITFADTKEEIKENLQNALLETDGFHKIKRERAKKNICHYIKTYLK